ncbi:MAG TPA: flavin reductase [Chitinophagaceae bacterium]|jgi:flavin reductase (DIM6/NTAB) family NADH-FMN oxidoreductase RutF|nr:flavin reductase [Chitinophagaceae bacterium]
MATFSSADITSWERFYRANFINSLTGFKSVSLIGTTDSNGRTNLGVFSSIVHIGSDPALVGYINRPRKAAPHTLANIEATGVYSINHIQAAWLEKAHQSSAKYPEEVSEFDAVGLTAEFVAPFTAPFVKESPVKYALSLQEIIPIRLNNTFLVIGKIEWVKLEGDFLCPDGFIDLQQAGSLCSNGTDSYYHTQAAGRYSYAKPGIPPQKIA